MRKKSVLTRFVILVMLLGAAGVMGWRIFNRPKPAAAVSISAIREQNGMPVTVRRIVSAPWEYWLPLYGTVRTSGLSEVYASQAEYVTSLGAEVGDAVKKGQVLATLDSQKASERVQAARARFDEISMKYERTQELQKAGGSSRQDVENVFSQYKEASASLQQLQTELTRHKVVSPIDGVVMQRSAEIGLLASTGRPLYVIGDPKLFEIAIDLSPRYIQSVRNGEPAKFLSSVGEWEPATVKRVDPMADALTGLYSVVLDVQSSNLHLGASVEAQIRIEHDESVIVAPYESIREAEGVAKAYVRSGDIAVERIVKKGRTNEFGLTHVLSGVAEGEEIVLKGADRMYDGARIWVQEETDSQLAPSAKES